MFIALAEGERRQYGCVYGSTGLGLSAGDGEGKQVGRGRLTGNRIRQSRNDGKSCWTSCRQRIPQDIRRSIRLGVSARLKRFPLLLLILVELGFPHSEPDSSVSLTTECWNKPDRLVSSSFEDRRAQCTGCSAHFQCAHS